MATEGFDYKEEYQGTGDTQTYSFNFRIFDPGQLHIYIQDSLGNIVSDARADDATVVAGVTLDTVKGGGSITLAQVLGNAFTLHIFLANDFPDQPTDFPNKKSFTFDVLEGALDYITAWGQRAAYLAQRALRLHDLDDIDGFDMRLPMGLSNNPNAFLQVNAAGNGWAVGPTLASIITQAVTQAEIATQAMINNAFTLTLLHAGTWTIPNNTNMDLLNQVTDKTAITMVDYVARIRRGGTTYARQEFSIFFRSNNWEIAIAGDRYADAAIDHGVTFTANAATGQINAAVANDGGSDAVIDLYKITWPI